ncbi:MAG: phage holin family protein [Thermoleophilaceae bacterium]
MSHGNGSPPPGSADKSLGEIVAEVSEKASLLVREEIELAKTEVTQKVTRLGRGAAVGAAAGVFLFFAFVLFLHALSWFWVDLLDLTSIWIGFLITTGILILLGLVAGLLAYRFLKKGSPPTPDMAIEEAKRTREAIEEARHS